MKKSISRILATLALMSISTFFSFAQVNLLEMAKGAYETQNYKEAANYLYQILQNDPSNAEAYLLYSKVYMAVDDKPQAASILSYALSKVQEPENRMRLRLERTNLLSLLNIPESALSEAQKLKNEFPKNAKILTTLAKCQNACSDSLAALNTLRIAHRIDKKSTEIHALLIKALVATGAHKEALKELDNLYAVCQKLSFDINNEELTNEFMFALSGLYENYPKLNENKKTAHIITDFYGKTGLLPMENDDLFHNRELIDEMAAYVEMNRDRLVSRRNDVSDYERMLLFVGSLYSEINDYPTALSYMERCINSDLSDDLRLDYTLIDLSYCGHIEKIKSITQKELERISKNPALSSQEKLDLQHKVTSRCAFYLATEGLADETINFCNEYGIYHEYDFTIIAHYLKGEYDKALARIDEFDDTTTPQTLLMRANILNLLNRQEEAREVLENVIILSDEESDLCSAVAYAALGDTAKALSLADNYVNSSYCNNNTRECSYLAAIYAIAHNDQRACEYIDIAFKISPKAAFGLINNNILTIVPPSFFSGKDFVSLKAKMDACRQDLFEKTDKFFK